MGRVRILAIDKIVGWELVSVEPQSAFAVYKDGEGEDYFNQIAVVDLRRGEKKFFNVRMVGEIKIWGEKNSSDENILKVEIFNEVEVKIFTFWRGDNSLEPPILFSLEVWERELAEKGEEIFELKKSAP